MARSKEVEAIVSSGIALHNMGVSNWALSKAQALSALDKFEIEKISVLGGDVYELNDGEPESNRDNWYCDREPDEAFENFVARSISKARVYISNYRNPNQKQEMFVIVAEQNDTDIQKTTPRDSAVLQAIENQFPNMSNRRFARYQMSKVDWLRNLWKQPELNRMVGNQNMNMARFVTYLFRFMQIFKIARFQIFFVTKTSVHALVGWPDDGRVDYDENEEVQEVAWDVQEFENYEDTFLLAEYL